MLKKLVGHKIFNKVFIKKSDSYKLNNQICIIKTFQNKIFLIFLLKYYNVLGLCDLNEIKEIKYYKCLHRDALLCVIKYYKNNQFYILTSSMIIV